MSEVYLMILIWGKTGWIGSQLLQLLHQQGKVAFGAQSRLEQREAISRELDQIKPTIVLNAAGLTGRPNVDWCESHQIEVIQVNVLGVLTLADLCNERGIHLTNFGTVFAFFTSKLAISHGLHLRV